MGNVIQTTKRIERVQDGFAGQWVARAAPWGDDGYVCEVAFPLPDDEHALTFHVAIPPGLISRLCSEAMLYRSEVSGYGFEEPGTIYLPNGYVIAPTWEVGLDIAPILAGVGGVIGTAVGGPAGTAIGGALGGLAGSAISAATDDTPPARPGNLPAVGSTANRARILNFLNITPGEDAASVRAKLLDGTHRGWDPGDLNDAAAMLARVPPSGPVALELLTASAAPAAAAPAGNQADGLAGLQIAPQVQQQVAPGLTQMLGAATGAPGSVGNAPAALLAGARALLGQQGAAADLSSVYGANAPAVLDLTRRALRGLDATAASLTGDPYALEIVRQTRQRQEDHIANAWRLFDSLSSFARGVNQ